MATHDDDEALKQAVREAAEEHKKVKSRADRITANLLTGNKRQRDLIESMRKASQVLGE